MKALLVKIFFYLFVSHFDFFLETMSVVEIGSLLCKKRKLPNSPVKPKAPPKPLPPSTMHPDDLLGYPLCEDQPSVVFLSRFASPLETSKLFIKRLETTRSFFNELKKNAQGSDCFILDNDYPLQFSVRVLVFAQVAFAWNDKPEELARYCPTNVALRYQTIVKGCSLYNKHKIDIDQTLDFLLHYFFPYLGII